MRIPSSQRARLCRAAIEFVAYLTPHIHSGMTRKQKDEVVDAPLTRDERERLLEWIQMLREVQAEAAQDGDVH